MGTSKPENHKGHGSLSCNSIAQLILNWHAAPVTGLLFLLTIDPAEKVSSNAALLHLKLLYFPQAGVSTKKSTS